MFPDENDSDISERIKDLFDFEIKDTSNQIFYAEDLPRKITCYLFNLLINNIQLLIQF